MNNIFTNGHNYPVHPLVQAITLNQCNMNTPATSKYDPMAMVYDPLCSYWIDWTMSMANQWAQGSGLLIVFGLVVLFYILFLGINMLTYVIKNFFAPTMDDYTRYNLMNA